MKYTIELYNPNGERLADISHLCLTRTYTLRRNRAEDIYLTLNLEKAQELAQKLGMGFYQLYAAGITEVRITRGNRPMVGGQLLYVHPRLNKTAPPTLELRAAGFLELWSKRFIATIFQNQGVIGTDIGMAAWQVMNEFQTILDGEEWDFGVTQGTIQASRAITESWALYGSSIKEILIGLAERIDSGDFEFTPDKVFNWYYPGIGTDKTELLFSYPGNITSIGAPVDATTLANSVIARGEGNGSSQFVGSSQDTASQAVYKVRQRVDDYPSVRDTATLDDKAEEATRLYATPTMIPDITLDGTKEPYLGSYWIGDRVRFSVDVNRYPAFTVLDGQVWRINEITCSVDENDHEDITLKVGYS